MIALGARSASAENLYGELRAAGVDVLLDSTDERAGAKFAVADLLGAPVRVVFGDKSSAGECAELNGSIVPLAGLAEKVLEALK